MLDLILNFLTWAVIAFEITGIVVGVIVFVLAATWMQVNEQKEKDHEREASA